MGLKAAWVTTTPGATPVCTRINAESPSRFFLERAPKSCWLVCQPGLRVESLPSNRLLALMRTRGVSRFGGDRHESAGKDTYAEPTRQGRRCLRLLYHRRDSNSQRPDLE